MKNKILRATVVLLFTGLLFSNMHDLYAQSGALAVQDTALLEQQLDYIYEQTRVYNDYRAIREDVYLKLVKNVTDTLSAARLEAEGLNNRLTEQDFQIETLNTDLARTRKEMDEAVKNRDSLSFLGIQMKKGLYNLIMWAIILGLAAVSGILITLFKRAHLVTKEVKQELNSTQKEFEQYRKTSREKYEKLVVSHHSEIMKLKNS